jgi:hypothetical protein
MVLISRLTSLLFPSCFRVLYVRAADKVHISESTKFLLEKIGGFCVGLRGPVDVKVSRSVH